MTTIKQNNLKNIPIKDLEPNKGQIEGLPKNPRKIEPHRFDKLKKSIEDAPEMLDYRRLLVFPLNNKFVVVAGNMRLKAAKEIGYTEMPCYVLDESTSAEKLREYAIKDNNAFGETDWDALNEWDESKLLGWGMELLGDTVNDVQDITEIANPKESFDFKIKCKNMDELSELQSMLHTKGRNMTFSKYKEL